MSRVRRSWARRDVMHALGARNRRTVSDADRARQRARDNRNHTSMAGGAPHRHRRRRGVRLAQGSQCGGEGESCLVRRRTGPVAISAQRHTPGACGISCGRALTTEIAAATFARQLGSLGPSVLGPTSRSVLVDPRRAVPAIWEYDWHCHGFNVASANPFRYCCHTRRQTTAGQNPRRAVPGGRERKP